MEDVTKTCEQCGEQTPEWFVSSNNAFGIAEIYCRECEDIRAEKYDSEAPCECPRKYGCDNLVRTEIRINDEMFRMTRESTGQGLDEVINFALEIADRFGIAIRDRASAGLIADAILQDDRVSWCDVAVAAQYHGQDCEQGGSPACPACGVIGGWREYSDPELLTCEPCGFGSRVSVSGSVIGDDRIAEVEDEARQDLAHAIATSRHSSDPERAETARRLIPGLTLRLQIASRVRLAAAVAGQKHGA